MLSKKQVPFISLDMQEKRKFEAPQRILVPKNDIKKEMENI